MARLKTVSLHRGLRHKCTLALYAIVVLHLQEQAVAFFHNLQNPLYLDGELVLKTLFEKQVEHLLANGSGRKFDFGFEFRDLLLQSNKIEEINGVKVSP